MFLSIGITLTQGFFYQFLETGTSDRTNRDHLLKSLCFILYRIIPFSFFSFSPSLSSYFLSFFLFLSSFPLLLFSIVLQLSFFSFLHSIFSYFLLYSIYLSFFSFLPSISSYFLSFSIFPFPFFSFCIWFGRESDLTSCIKKYLIVCTN